MSIEKKNLDINDEYEGILLTEKKQFIKSSNDLNELNENELLIEYNVWIFVK